VASPVLDVRGVGRKTARRLMERFGGLNKIQRATLEELKEVEGISDVLARAIYDHFHQRAPDGG